MFGMSSTEFWEEDPQLYWAYRTFYLKKIEAEYEEKLYDAWLKGSMNHIAVSVALCNAFSKQKTDYPTYESIKSKKEEKEDNKLTEKNINKLVQEQYNNWARY